MENKIEIPKRVIKTKKTAGQIYIIRNLINNKVYIGETTIGYKSRFAQHCKKSTRINRHYKLYNAMNEFGIENFYVELLEDNVPIEKMYEREIYYIEKYNSFYDGYNSTKGGNGRIINEVNDISKIINLHKKGNTAKEISVIMDYTPYTIIRTLRRYGYKPYISKYEKFDIKKFESMWNDKSISLKQIAAYYHVDERTIRRYVTRLGLPHRHNWNTKKSTLYI